MYILKHFPEDFIVDEVSTIVPEPSGKFLYFRLKKRGLNTVDALKNIAVQLGVSMKRFSFAGLKDKNAVTSQVCSVDGICKETFERVSLENIKLEVLGFGDEPVHLGCLEGNLFRVVVRNLDVLPAINSRFRNLFGEQRFSEQNADVGRHLVKREFEFAARLLNVSSGRDLVGALRKYSRKRLLFFVHAYQSLLWNRAALLTSMDRLPVVGFGTVVDDEATKQVLAEEGVRSSDFVIRELPEVSAEGAVREVWVVAEQLKVGKLESDECFPSKNKVVLEFFLKKGCYATEFVRQNFQPHVNN